MSLGHAVIKKTQLGTAMDTILIMVVVVTLPSLIIYGVTRNLILLIIATVPILHFIRVYDHFMKNNSKMLRSERHEETMLKIASGMGQKGGELDEKVVEALPATTAPRGEERNG